MKRFIFIILSATIFSGCSCAQRLEHLQRHCPECFNSVTAPVPLSVPVPERLADFTVPLDALEADRPLVLHAPDNITLSLTITGDDSLSATVTIPPDTVTITQPVTLPCPQCPTCSSLPDIIVQILALLAIVLLFAWTTAHTIRQILNEHGKQPDM